MKLLLRVVSCLVIVIHVREYFAFAVSCSLNCNCTSQEIELLGTRKYFVLDCLGDNTLTVVNASAADVFIYKNLDSLTVFDTNILRKFHNLKSLHIDGGLNSLWSIPRISSLKILSITRTSLSHIFDNTITRVSSLLLSLSLPSNDIQYLGDKSFAGLATLRFLNLSHNRIDKLPYVDSTTLSIETLDLSFNHLRGLSSSNFMGFKSLKLLYLDNNKIYSLNFVNFPNSGVSFFIRNNPITSILWEASTNTKLLLLDISGNRLTEVRPHTFVNANVLTLKITSSSRLRLVDADVFRNTTLVTIDLSDNPQLQFVDPQAFTSVEGLQSIDVSNNNLFVVPQEWAHIDTVKQISAAGNRLLCDCNLFYWQDRENSTAVAVTISSDTHLPVCRDGSSMGPQLPSQCAPRLLYRSNNWTAIEEGINTTLRCKVGGVPTPSIQWIYGNRPLPLGDNFNVVHSDLMIVHSRPANSGVYQCLAKNTQGLLKTSFILSVKKDHARIVIIKTGKDYVEFSWRTRNKFRRYKAILIDVTTNNQTSYAIKQFTRSRHSQSGYIISKLQSETTYRVCLAYEDQTRANSEKCQTFTTKSASLDTPRGITDYSLYGIVVAAIVSFLFICIIVCVCITSRNYTARKRKEMAEGIVSESSYGLMTTTFSQRSGISSMYDNPGASVSRAGSYYKYKRNPNSTGHTPTSQTVCFAPEVHFNDGTGLFRTLQRTVSDPLLSIASHYE